MYSRKKEMGLQEFRLAEAGLRSRFIDWNNETAAARNGINESCHNSLLELCSDVGKITLRKLDWLGENNDYIDKEMFSARERDRYEE